MFNTGGSQTKVEVVEMFLRDENISKINKTQREILICHCDWRESCQVIGEMAENTWKFWSSLVPVKKTNSSQWCG